MSLILKPLIPKLVNQRYDPLGSIFKTLWTALKDELLPDIIKEIMCYLSYIESTLDGVENFHVPASETFDSFGTEIAFVIKPPNYTDVVKKSDKYKLNYNYKISSIKVQLNHRSKCVWYEQGECRSYCAIQKFINDEHYKNQPGTTTDKYPLLWESKMFETKEYVEFKNIDLILNDKDYYIWYLYKDSSDSTYHYNPIVNVVESCKQNSKFLDNLKLTHHISYYKSTNCYSDTSKRFVMFYQIEFVLNF